VIIENKSLILHPDLRDNNTKKMDFISELQKELTVINEFPVFKSGDTVTVSYKIIEGAKERVQQFQGVVLQRKGSGATETFTVRKMSGNVGVERIFPMASPFVDKITINKKGAVRRARIFYFRERTGKSARIKEKRMYVAAK
jgi:large subunit ribosomal protein L19